MRWRKYKNGWLLASFSTPLPRLLRQVKEYKTIHGMLERTMKAKKGLKSDSPIGLAKEYPTLLPFPTVSCPKCGKRNIIYDPEVGEIVCTKCAVVLWPEKLSR